MPEGRHTLVLDIGKSHAKLVLIGADGEAGWSRRCANQSVPAPEWGYLALGTERLEAWLDETLPQLPQAPDRIAITTHGAAFCALGEQGLVLPPIDYEWDGYGGTGTAFDASLENFQHHGTPRLPQGLNAGRQIDYVHRRFPQAAARIRAWLPYPQYWAWWFSATACSERSSLGCHTGLWAPAAGRFSDWALASGIAALFPPLRAAWEVVGRVDPRRAQAWGWSEAVEVIAGVHDSNACLARHLRHHAEATVVSTGTWFIAMAPGADTARLSVRRDELVNVAVDGRPVATARFMSGREFAELCGSADPAAATAAALDEVLAQRWMALPAFAESGGPFVGQRGQVLRDGELCASAVAAVPDALRPALAALYCAEMGALIVNDLAPARPAQSPVILEGPLAQNEAFCLAFASLLAPRPVLRSCDELEGTARGAWMLAHWNDADNGAPRLEPVPAADARLRERLQAHAGEWASRTAARAA